MIKVIKILLKLNLRRRIVVTESLQQISRLNQLNYKFNNMLKTDILNLYMLKLYTLEYNV